MKLLNNEYKIEKIADDLYQITLEQPFYIQNKLYLILDKYPLLIDTGYIESFGSLARSLKEINLGFKKIHFICFTHPHIDHISGGLLISAVYSKIKMAGHANILSDIPDYMKYVNEWKDDTLRLINSAYEEKQSRKRIDDFNENWEDFLKRLENYETRHRPINKIKLDIPLRDKSVLTTGKYNFEIIETPGHSKHHIVLIEKKKKWAFSGDMVIGNIPAIYGHWDGNLDLYKSSLQKLAAYDDCTFFPAHGEIIENPGRKIKLILKTLEMLEKKILKKFPKKGINLREAALLIIPPNAENDADLWYIALALTESILEILINKGLLNLKTGDNNQKIYKSNH
ncbi:MAG: MBL fold metallo-hydrolase [Spirochaetia bacterium]|nr:MBL fold metallo-hydrolase [Spirochaetia bacterium]